MADRLLQLSALLKEDPNEPFLLFALAKEYEKRSDTEQALQYYQRLLKEHPDYVGTYYHLGKSYEQGGELGKAFQTYKNGMEVASKQGDQHALGELAAAKLNLGDDEDFED